MQREREQFLKRGSRRRSFNKRKIRFSSNNGNINLISGISSRDCEYLCKFESTLRALLKNLFHLPSIGTRVILWMFYRRDRTKERKKPMPFERCRWNCIFLEAYLFVVNSRNGYGQTDKIVFSVIHSEFFVALSYRRTVKIARETKHDLSMNLSSVAQSFYGSRNIFLMPYMAN